MCNLAEDTFYSKVSACHIYGYLLVFVVVCVIFFFFFPNHHILVFRCCSSSLSSVAPCYYMLIYLFLWFFISTWSTHSRSSWPAIIACPFRFSYLEFRMRVIAIALAAAAFLAVTAVAHSSPACPSYEGAADFCHNVTVPTSKRARCAFWSCMIQFCSLDFVQETQHKYCHVSHTAPRMKLPHSPLPSSATLRSTPLAIGTPDAASPCGGGSGAMTSAQIRHWLLDTAMNVYYDRSNEHYTEGNQRWSGITGQVCPPKAPPYSDCSSTVTWIYWTLFGNGPDFMNGEKWQAGYTGTLDQHGVNVTVNTNDLAIGDLCFYYHPMHHVAIYVGGGKVVSHGMDPVGYYNYDYAPIDFCRRYI